MDKFVDKNGKVILKIEDDGSQVIDQAYFNDIAGQKNTTVVDGHAHTYTVDQHGGGLTSTNEGHSHSIIKWLVQPADGHGHKLLKASGD